MYSLIAFTLCCGLRRCWFPFVIPVAQGFLATTIINVIFAGFTACHTFRLIAFGCVAKTTLHFNALFTCKEMQKGGQFLF